MTSSENLIKNIEFNMDTLKEKIDTLNNRIRPPFENGMFDLILEKKELEGELKAYSDILLYIKFI